jgi:hypothetical protein
MAPSQQLSSNLYHLLRLRKCKHVKEEHEKEKMRSYKKVFFLLRCTTFYFIYHLTFKEIIVAIYSLPQTQEKEFVGNTKCQS